MPTPDLATLTDTVAALIRLHYPTLAEGDDDGVRLLVCEIKHEVYAEWFRHKMAGAVTIPEGEEVTRAGSVRG